QHIMYGFSLQNVVARPAQPLRIEQCSIRPGLARSNDGINIIGRFEKEPASGICIRSNRISNSNRGIFLTGALRDVHVSSNLLVNCPASGVQIEDLSPISRGLLVANNTALGGGSAFRVWNNVPNQDPVGGQVEVANNLFF